MANFLIVEIILTKIDWGECMSGNLRYGDYLNLFEGGWKPMIYNVHRTLYNIKTPILIYI